MLVDFGVTHSLLLSYARAAAQRGELDAEGASKRGHAANIYADKKNTRYSRIITERSLDINYRSFIVESFGAFASVCHRSLCMGDVWGPFLQQGGEFERFGNH